MTLSEKRRIAGRKGGLATLERHSTEHFSTIGKLHRKPTYSEIMAKSENMETALASDYLHSKKISRYLGVGVGI